MVTNSKECLRCSHRADSHHQFEPHICGRGGCECAGIVLGAKPRKVGLGITPDRFVLPVFVPGSEPVVCFGCGEAIAEGTHFLQRRYCTNPDERLQPWFDTSKERVPFCPACGPFKGKDAPRASRAAAVEVET